MGHDHLLATRFDQRRDGCITLGGLPTALPTVRITSITKLAGLVQQRNRGGSQQDIAAYFFRKQLHMHEA